MSATVCLLFILGATGPASAVDVSWGCESAFFDTSSCWSTNALPGETDSAIFDSAAVQTVGWDSNVLGNWQAATGSAATVVTNEGLRVENGDVTIRKTGGTAFRYLIMGTANIINDGRLRIGALGQPMALDVGGTDISTGGTLDVTGTGSEWNGGNLLVGNSIAGNGGVLNVQAGGYVRSRISNIGNIGGSTGTATVTGPGSRWDSYLGLRVGYSGTGALNVEAGGVVTSEIDNDIGNEAGSMGTVTVTGAGSQWNMPERLLVGKFGTGVLNVEAGGVVTDTGGFLGDEVGSMGTVTVTGPGSQWNNSESLVVGRLGTGALNVEAAGVVTNPYGTIANDAGSASTVTVTGPGSQWNNEFSLTVGNFGTGVLNVAAGGVVNVEADGEVNNKGGFLANEAGSMATVTVTGPGSQWNILESLVVGRLGTGVLNVEAGGVVTSIGGVIGEFASSASTATVAGAGSQWNISGDLFVGFSGNVILAGGEISADTVDLRGGLEGFGTLTGMFAASDTSNTGAILAQGGTLNVGDAGRFNAFNTLASVTVEPGATLNILTKSNFNRLSPVTQLDGGVLTSNTGFGLDLGRVINGEGAVDARIAAVGGSAIIATGTLALGKQDAFDGFFSDGVLDVGNHEVTINDRDEAVLGSLTEIGNGVGAGSLIAANGLLIEFGKTVSGYGVVQGDILNNGLIHGEGPGFFDLLDLQGLVNGVGDFSGTVQFSGGFSPGLSPTITNGENLIFNSFLEIEIGGLTPGSEHDQLDATGFVLVEGLLDITLINAWTPSLGDAYTLILAEEIISAGGAAPSFATINFPQLADGLRFLLELNLDPTGRDSLVLRVAAVPLPGALWLFVPGLAVLVRRRRNKRIK